MILDDNSDQTLPDIRRLSFLFVASYLMMLVEIKAGNTFWHRSFLRIIQCLDLSGTEGSVVDADIVDETREIVGSVIQPSDSSWVCPIGNVSKGARSRSNDDAIFH